MTAAGLGARLRHLFIGTLRRQLVTGVALVHAVLMAGFVWDITQRQQEMLLERLGEQAAALATGLASTASGSVLSRDLAALRELVGAQSGQPDLAYAMILDHQGRVLAHTDAGRIGLAVEDLPPQPVAQMLARSITLVDAVAPVTVGERHAGWARVGVAPQARTQARLATIVREGLLYAAAAILVGSGLAWLMARRLTGRLAHIQAVADAVDRGLPGQRAALSGDDEAAHLAQSFNRMVQGVVSARDALAQSERRLRLALEAAVMVPWRWQASTNQLDWGEESDHLLGAPPAGGYPRLSAMVLAEDHGRLVSAWRTARRDPAGSYQAQFRLHRTDGGLRWLQAQGRVERNAEGRATGLLGVCQDVTEAKLAEQRLHASETRARQIIENSPDALIVMDPQGVVVQTNGRVESMFGYRAHELIGQSANRLWQSSQTAGTPPLDATAAGASNVEFLGLRKDGSTFHAQVNLARLPDAGSSQLIAAVRDETEARALKTELIRHRDHLEEVVASRTAELTLARVEAERLARVKTEFLAHMSHEIRTPLNAVLGLAQMGRAKAGSLAAQAAFANIHDAGQQLLHVVNDILEYSRLDAGKLTLEQRPFALKELLASVMQLAQGLAQQKGLDLRSRLALDLPPWVMGDAHRLRQVLVNLLGNAIKFTETGHVLLQVSRGPQGLVFRVEDTGIGMSPEQLARLFKPFEQGDTSTTRRFGGSGLGLAICHDLVGLMQGRIELDTLPGRGSVFTVSLPLVDVQAPEPQPAPPCHAGGAPRLTGMRVLAAEDVEVNRMVLDAMLQHEGAQPVFAENGQQAVQAVRTGGQHGFDAVLMDVQMPLMDGYEATREIHRLAPDLPVIGLTAYALPEERRQCLSAGMVAHATKPVDIEQLVTLLRRHTQRA